MAEVERMEGVGRRVSGLIRVWKCVEKRSGGGRLEVRSRRKIRTLAKAIIFFTDSLGFDFRLRFSAYSIHERLR